jgi:YbbR domain-containing protein
MLRLLREFVKSIPTLVLSLVLAIAVWISAVTAADPVEQRLFPRAVTIERVGQDPSLVITGDLPSQATVTLSAPRSVWDRILSDRNPIRAWIDLSGLEAGTHSVEVNVQQLYNPVRLVSQNPVRVDITLERLASQEFPIRLITRGQPAIGFRADQAVLSQEVVTISGPASRVERVREVRVVVDVNQVSETFNRVLEVQVLNENEVRVEGVTLFPEQVTVNQPVTRLGGYRNLVVRVITTGQPAVGYRLTNVSVFPPTVTVFSNNPQLVEGLPGFVETSPLEITGVRDDVEVRLSLNLPRGVSVVGEQQVTVQVGVAAIEDSITLSGVAVEVANLPPELTAQFSPTTVDVIVSGPVLLLDQLGPEVISVVVDLNGVVSGTYQFAPRVTLAISELRVESILPSSIEVVVELAPTPTPTPTLTVTPTVTPGR